MSLKGLELPDFLKVGNTNENNGGGDADEYSEDELDDFDRKLATTSNSICDESDFDCDATPLSRQLPAHDDRSFSNDGIFPPSHGHLERYFSHLRFQPTTPDFNDSQLMENSLGDIGLGSTSRCHQTEVNGRRVSSQSAASVQSFAGSGVIQVDANSFAVPAVPKRRLPLCHNNERDSTDGSGHSMSHSSSSVSLPMVRPCGTTENWYVTRPAAIKLIGMEARERFISQKSISDSELVDHTLLSRDMYAEEISTPSPTTHELVLDNDGSGECTLSDNETLGTTKSTLRNETTSPESNETRFYTAV